MEFFNKYKITIFRILGALMLIVAFSMFFWTTPKDGLSENEQAARNIARMEARMAGNSMSSTPSKPSQSPIMKSYKETQAKQMRYALIITMIIGFGLLVYSFINKKES